MGSQDLPNFLSPPSVSAAGDILAAKHPSTSHCSLLQNFSMELGVMAQAYCPSTGEAEAGGLPKVAGERENIWQRPMIGHSHMKVFFLWDTRTARLKAYMARLGRL